MIVKREALSGVYEIAGESPSTAIWRVMKFISPREREREREREAERVNEKRRMREFATREKRQVQARFEDSLNFRGGWQIATPRNAVSLKHSLVPQRRIVLAISYSYISKNLSQLRNYFRWLQCIKYAGIRAKLETKYRK